MKKIFFSLLSILLLSACQITPKSRDISTPDKALITFFDHLTEENYTAASSLFAWSDPQARQGVRVFSAPEDEDGAMVLKRYCQSTATCLKAEVLKVNEVQNGWELTTQFHHPDGSLFVLGPCCGATEEEMPPQDIFTFLVRSMDGELKVATPPVYVP